MNNKIILPSEIYRNASNAYGFTPWCLYDICESEKKLLNEISRLKKVNRKNKGDMSMYKGKILNDLNKEELIDIINDIGNAYNRMLCENSK